VRYSPDRVGLERKWSMHRSVFVLSLVAALALSCSAPVRPYTCRVDPEFADVDVHAAWGCNRDVLRRIVRGKAFSLREFRSAADFFEDLTGLRVDWDGTFVGMLPGPDLDRDLEDLDAWYELHRHGLRWDAGPGKVVLEGLAPAPEPG